MHAKNLLALLQVGQLYMYLTVKTTSTQQRGIQDICAVSSRQDNHTRIASEAVHLGEQLVQRRFALVIAAAHHVISATGTTHSIDFIDKNNSRSFLLGLAEQVTHTAGTHAHEHLHKVATRHGEEGHIRLTCHCLSEQCFTCTWRAYQQHALRNLTS